MKWLFCTTARILAGITVEAKVDQPITLQQIPVMTAHVLRLFRNINQINQREGGENILESPNNICMAHQLNVCLLVFLVFVWWPLEIEVPKRGVKF